MEKNVLLLQVPSKFYEVVPIFYKEASTFGIFDKFYIATDHKNAKSPGKNCIILNLEKDHRFCTNMYRLLEIVKEDVFLVCCEDHIMTDKSDPDKILKAFNLVRNNDKIGYLRLSRNKRIPLIDGDNDFISQINISYRYYISLQPAIWRRSYFKTALKKKDTAWTFEIQGTKRIRKEKEKGLKMSSFCCVENKVFDYMNFYKDGKYLRDHFVDYAIKKGIEINNKMKVLVKERPSGLKYILTYEEYVKKLKNES